MSPADDAEREIEARRKRGESWLSELLMSPPNRFSRARSGQDAFLMGLLSLLCLLPLGPLAILRAVRCNDQRAAAGLPPSKLALTGALLGLVGTILLLFVLAALLG